MSLSALPGAAQDQFLKVGPSPRARPIFGGLCARGRKSAKISRSSRKVQNLSAGFGSIRQSCPKIRSSGSSSKTCLLNSGLTAHNLCQSQSDWRHLLFQRGRAGLTALRPFRFEFRGKGRKFSAFPYVGNCHYFCGSSAFSGAGDLPAPLEMGKANCRGGPFPPQHRTKVRCARQNCLARACVQLHVLSDCTRTLRT